MTRRIFLTGFMGAGKTTVGELLARELRLPFEDLDRRVEELAGRAVAEIFAERGEAGFRRLERRALEAVAAGPPAVIATGGGILWSAGNRELMRRSGVTVWLDTGFATAAARVTAGGERPLFRDLEAARALYERRRPVYEKQADLRVEIGADEPPPAIAARVLERLSTCAT